MHINRIVWVKGIHYIGIIAKMIIILILSTIIGTGLMIGVYNIPTSNMDKHLKQTVDLLEHEDTYPMGMGIMSLTRDNWTDSNMISEAIYNIEKSPIVEAMENKYIMYDDSENPLEALVDYVNGRPDYMAIDYGRYWHGYLLFLKPILYFTDYIHIKNINLLLQPLLFASIIYYMYNLSYTKHSIIALVITILFMRPIVIPYCMQFSTVFYIMLIACLIMLMRPKVMAGENKYYFFLIIGILTSFFDFLTYPLVTFGIPMTMYLLGKDKSDKNSKCVISCGFSWLAGYGLFWASKWIVGSIICNENFIKNAFEQIMFRSSDVVSIGSSEKISYFFTLIYNITSKCFIWMVVTLIFSLITIFILIYSSKKYFNNLQTVNFKAYILKFMPFILLAVSPFIWYYVLKNHSYIHYWFTSRTLAITVFAVYGYISEIKNELNRI